MSWGRALSTSAGVALLRARRRSSTYAICALALIPPAIGALVGALGQGSLDTAGPLAIRLVAPLLAVALVAGTVAEQYEQRTVVYYYVRPVSRAAVVLGEWLGYALLVCSVLALSGLLIAIAAGATAAAGAPGDWAARLRVPLVLAGEGAVLVAFCVGIATLVPKRPLVVAAGIMVLTEGLLASVPGAKNISLSHNVLRLAGLAETATETARRTGMDDMAGGLGMPAAEQAASTDLSSIASVLVLALYGLLPLLMAMVVVKDRDLR